MLQIHNLRAPVAGMPILKGFMKEALPQPPMEVAVEAQKLLGISLEGSIGR